MKLGVIQKFYFDFFSFLKQKKYFENDNILIYVFNNFNDLDIALEANCIDIALTTCSLICQNDEVYNGIPFIKNAFKIFGNQNCIEKLKNIDSLLKVGLPQKNIAFKKYFYSFYRFFHGRSQKIQWLDITDKDLDILFEQDFLDFAIIPEPSTFEVINRRIAALLAHKNSYEIPLLFVYNKNLLDDEKINKFKSSVLKIKTDILESNLINEFLILSNNKYEYLKDYAKIFKENFVKDNDLKVRICNSNTKKANGESVYFNDSELIKIIKSEISRLILYGTNQVEDCNVGIIKEIELIKNLIKNYKNREKLDNIKIQALKNKNLVLSEDLSNRQKTLSDLFMQFRTTSENLLITNIQVQESIKEKERLIAIISHDLKTPLSGILAITQQLYEVEKDEEKKKKLSIISESGNTLLLLINNLLENAKNLASSRKLDEKMFDLKSLVDSISANIKEKLKTKNVEFILEYDESIPKMVFGDPLKLNQILYNLLGNSVKFTLKGFIKLKLNLMEKDNDLCKISIQVQDTGIGIAEDKIEHVFEPFIQEDDSIKEKFGGTGLGLSIVKDYIELMGGVIDCRSKKNEGTTFTIILSFKIPEKTENESRIESFHKYIVFKESKILILEDNLINQEIIQGYLNEYPTLRLVFRQNGKEGLEEIKRQKFDLILSDIMMPEMDGKTFCQNFRAIDKETPIVALTAFDSKEDVEELINLGFNSVIPKPYKKDELLKGILNYISARELSEEEVKVYEIAEKAKNSDKIDKFKKLFVMDLKERFRELKEGIENKDKEKMKFFAHNLKGIAPTLGFPEFAKLAEEVSHLYKEDKWTELVKIKDEFLRKIEELSENL